MKTKKVASPLKNILNTGEIPDGSMGMNPPLVNSDQLVDLVKKEPQNDSVNPKKKSRDQLTQADFPKSFVIFDIPENWTWISVKDATSLMQYGISVKAESNEKSGIPILRMGNIQEGSIDLTDLKFIPENTESLSNFIVEKGDILFNRTNSPELVGKSAVYKERIRVVFASYLVRVRPNNNLILSDYLCWWINSMWGREWARTVRTDGVSQSNINAQKLSMMPVPLPPLDEQQRIVTRVEALLTHVNAVRDRLSRVPSIMKQLRQRVLATACSGRLTERWREENLDVEPAEDALLRCSQITSKQKSSKKIRRRGTVGMPEIDLPDDLPNTWTIKKIKELVNIGAVIDYQDGNHGELYPRTSDFGDTGIKFLTATQVFDNDVRLSEAPLLKTEKALQLRIGFAKSRDVLLTHNATVGRVALMPNNCGEIILGTSVTYYRLNPEFVDPSYCCYTMQGQFWQSQLSAIMEQTTRNQVSITKQAEFYLPLPPLTEQHEIVRRVGALFERADAIEREVVAATRRTEALTQAVLGKAFAGRL